MSVPALAELCLKAEQPKHNKTLNKTLADLGSAGSAKQYK